MSNVPSDSPQQIPPRDLQPPATGTVIQAWIEALKRSDRQMFILMAVEAWSIAKTMDDIFPGFWHRFMTNRRQAMQQFPQHKQQLDSLGNNPVCDSFQDE
ncbi:MAG: hypothetical protein VKL59_25540 [Nostocaceae cyanobacterium]|nr:hypothetical protein [Nostocaceae cyanobacterium]